MTICLSNFSPADMTAPVAFDSVADPHLPRAFIVPIADTVAVVMFDTDADAAGDCSARRLSAHLDGAPAAGPLLTSCLELRGGGSRHVLLLKRGAESLAECRLTLSLGGRPVAAIDPKWLQPPIIDGLSLIDGLSEQGQRRLLKLFLTTGASMFGLNVTSDLGAAVRSLLDQLGVAAAEFAGVVPVGRAGRILSYRVPGHWRDPRIAELVAQQSTRVSRLRSFALHLETSRRDGLCHVFLPEEHLPGAALIGLGDKPVLFPAPPIAAPQKPLAAWLAERNAATGLWVRELVESLARSDGVAAALWRELQPGAEPTLSVRHLSGTAGGVLYALEVRDPRALVSALRIERGAERLDVVLPECSRRTAASETLIGYAALPQTGSHEDTVRMRLIYHSGRVRTMQNVVAEAFDGRVPASFRGVDAERAARGIAQARCGMVWRTPALQRDTIGIHPANPRIALVAAVGDNLDIIHARAAMLALERGAAHVESVYHLADGETAGAARRVIAEAHTVFGLPFTVVTVAADAHPTERLRAALSSLRADVALVLGADVLPQGTGWLSMWCRALGRVDAPQVLGGTLLAAGAVADAGGKVDPVRPAVQGRRLIGMPERDLPNSASLATDLATANCVGLQRTAVDLFCSSASVHPNPNIVLAEVIERLRGDGRPARTYLRGRFYRYADDRVVDAIDALADQHAVAAIKGETSA